MKTRRTNSNRGTAPSIKDVAKEAGVSIAAASYALNGRDGVAETTRRRILKAVERLNYHPSKSAQTMRTGKTDAIGLVLPDLTNPFFPQFAKSVQQSAGALGKSVFLIDTNNDAAVEREGISRLLCQGVDGIIWWPASSENCEEFGNLTTPVVLVDFKKSGVDSVTSDHSLGGRMLATLINNSGFQRVGLIRGPDNFGSSALRRDGFVENLNNADWVVWEESNGYSPPLSPVIRERLAQASMDVVVCPNDLIAIEVIRFLRSIGKKIPGDVCVTGFGDIPFSDVVSPALTTIHQPLVEMGSHAVSLLNRRMEAPTSKAEDVILSVNVVIRDSLPAPIGTVVTA